MTTPCSTNPDLFFADDTESATHARAICKDCPAQLACLQLALDTSEPFGIWGGLTPADRERVAAGMEPKTCGLEGCVRPVYGRKDQRYCCAKHRDRAGHLRRERRPSAA